MPEREITRAEIERRAREFLQRASRNGTSYAALFEKLVEREVRLTIKQLEGVGKRVID